MSTLRSDTISGLNSDGPVFDGALKYTSENYMTLPKGTTTQSNRGRALLMGGAVSPGATNTTQIKYFDIASQGITNEFGQTTAARRSTGSVSSSTRAVMGGGFVSPPAPYTISNVMDYVTIATAANATDFGNMQSTAYSYATLSNETRGLFAGGYRPNNSAVVDTIDLITIATAANATDFGNLLAATHYYAATGNSTRTVWVGDAGITNTMEYVTIATTGNSIDWGDQGGTPQQSGGACSDSHGGLS
jgi:hypothetical protein